MRDPKRIREITKQLESIWSAFPDMRFHQFLTFIDCKTREILGKSQVITEDDLYNVEDEEASRALDHILRNIE